MKPASHPHPSLEELSAHLDGAAAAPDRPYRPYPIAEHLTACRHCGGRLAGLSQTRAALRALPRPDAPPEVGRRLRVALSAGARPGVLARFADLTALVALRWRRVLAPACALLLVAGAGVTYFESEARARASTTARESFERLLAAQRFESLLDGPALAADRLVGATWIEPSLRLADPADPAAGRPLRRLANASSEARSLLEFHGDARRALELPGVHAVRVRTARGPVEIERPSSRW